MLLNRVGALAAELEAAVELVACVVLGEAAPLV